jgi:ribosomal protein L37E
MTVKEVNSKKFDVLHNKRIDLKKCPICPNYDAEIIIPMPIYGKYMNTVYVRCKQCGHQTHHHSATTAFVDTERNRYGSWVTDKSLMHAIYSAIEEWNGRSKNGT